MLPDISRVPQRKVNFPGNDPSKSTGNTNGKKSYHYLTDKN